MLRFVFVLFVFCPTLVAVCRPTYAENGSMSAIDLYSKEKRKIPVVIATESQPDEPLILGQIAQVIHSDLSTSEEFVSKRHTMEHHSATSSVNDLMDSLKSESDNLALLSIKKSDTLGSYVVALKIYDTFSKGLITEKKYLVAPSGIRKAGHIMSDLITLSLTGNEGDFDTKLVYTEIISSKKGTRKIAAMDQDGHNHRYLTSEGSVMSPTYSIARKSVFYSDFSGGVSKIGIINVATGKTADLSSSYKGLAGHKIMSPSVSKDGSFMVFTAMSGDVANLYRLDFANGQVTKLTMSGLNVSPSLSPSATHIAYTSNISGKPSLYVMESNGEDNHRISFEKGHYLEPEWSPSGSWLVFTKIYHNVFSIGIMRPDGEEERTLFSGYQAESPAWSPSGTKIAFVYRERGDKTSRIVVVDTKGRQLKTLEAPGRIADISWIRTE